MASELAIAEALYEDLITPHFFGILVGTLLAGLLISQLLTYYTSPSVRLTTRRLDTWVVSIIAVSSTALLAVDWWNIFTFSIREAKNYMYPMTFHIADFVTVPLAAVCTAAAQIWFMERAWKVTNKSTIFLIINSLFIALPLASAFAILIISQLTVGDSDYYNVMVRLTIVVLWAGAIADLISTSVLVWKVLDTPITKSRAVLEITHLSFTTGALTSSVALTGGAVYLGTRFYSNAFIPFIDGLPRLCALSCMITLNYRQRWRESRHEGVANVRPLIDTEYTMSERSTKLPTDLSPTSTRFDCPTETTSSKSEERSSQGGEQSYFVLRHDGNESEVASGLHMSEIGDLTRLEKSLKYYQEHDGEVSPGMERARVYSVIMCEKPTRPAMGRDERRRSSGGVIVETLVSRRVERSP